MKNLDFDGQEILQNLRTWCDRNQYKVAGIKKHD